jgi:hypothetical protein
MAGINRSTGARWNAEDAKVKAELELSHPEQITERASIASKVEVAEHLSKAMYLVKPSDVPAIADTLSKVMGYHEATKTHNVNVTVNVAPDMLSLIRSRRASRIAAREAAALASGEPKQMGPGDPPIVTAAEAVSQPQDISKIPESGSR